MNVRVAIFDIIITCQKSEMSNNLIGQSLVCRWRLWIGDNLCLGTNTIIVTAD